MLIPQKISSVDITADVDQMIGCFCYCSAHKQTEPLPTGKVHALRIENRALFFIELWNSSLIFTQFVPGIYVVLEYTF